MDGNASSKAMYRGSLGSIASFAAMTLVAAPAAASGAPDDLGQWGLHCFCIDAVATPHSVIRMDDNGRILLRAIDGTTLAKLRSEGLKASDSQLRLLRLFDLIKRDGDTIRTAFPVLGQRDMAGLRARSAELGKRIAREVAPHVGSIQAELRRQGLEQSDYAVVFGYALDAVLWDRPAIKSRLPATALTVKQPYWRGAFWAMYPERPGSAGRNEIGQDKAKLVMVWADPVVDRLNLFAETSEAKALLSRIAANPDTARPGFPIIRDRPGDRLHDPSVAIADAVANALVESDEGRALLKAVPRANEQEALLIMAHELIWDVSEALLEADALSYPSVLGPDAASAPLTPLLYARIAD